MPPTPKPPGQRRRRNKDAPKGRKLAVSSQKRAPELPNQGQMQERTVIWWRRIWDSPMAAAWLDSDVSTLERMADLVDIAHKGEASAGVLGEIRALEDRFGLSPLARRRLQWEIDQAAVADHAASSDDGEPADEERFLRAVK